MTKFAGLPVVEPESQEMSSERLNRINRTMDEAVSSNQLPGVATVVCRRGEVVHTHVAGSRNMEKPDEPVGLDSLFRMYSQTKPVTAVVAMTLFEEGVIYMDDPISKWLPEFADLRVVDYPSATDKYRGIPIALGSTVAASREITVFDLMTMTSGLPGAGRTPAVYQDATNRAMEGSGFLPGDLLINDPPRSYEEMVLALAEAPLHSQPGETWNYGSDFDVLTILLQRASGKPLDELFQERIFGPLKMESACFYCGEANIDRLVTDHAWDLEGNLIVRDPPETAEKVGRSNRKLMSGNGLFGGMLASPPDYARFAQMLLNGGTLDGARIISRKTVDYMTTNHIGDRRVDIAVGPGYGFALGYCVREDIGGTFAQGSRGTYGWGGAAGTWFFVDPLEELWGLFFTHTFGYQFKPGADLHFRFERLVLESLDD